MPCTKYPYIYKYIAIYPYTDIQYLFNYGLAELNHSILMHMFITSHCKKNRPPAVPEQVQKASRLTQQRSTPVRGLQGQGCQMASFFWVAMQFVATMLLNRKPSIVSCLKQGHTTHFISYSCIPNSIKQYAVKSDARKR